MNDKPVDPVIIENIVKAIHEGKSTPFIGAGISGEVFKELKTASVVTHLAKGIHAWVPRKLQAISEYIEVIYSNSRNKVADHIKEVTGDIDNFITAPRNDDNSDQKDGWEALKKLAELPFPLYITTNYDDLLEQALIKANRKPRRVLSGWFLRIIEIETEKEESNANEKIVDVTVDASIHLKQLNDRLKREKSRVSFVSHVVSADDTDEPIVFHLHGHIDCPESMVLTDENYVDFMVAFSNSKKMFGLNIKELKSKPLVLPAFFESIFKNNDLLVVGYSLEDLNFQVLLGALRKVGKNRSKEKSTLSIQIDPGESDCFQKIFQTRLTEALNDPDVKKAVGINIKDKDKDKDKDKNLSAVDSLKIVRLVSNDFKEDTALQETQDGLESQKEFLSRFFHDKLIVNVDWHRGQVFIDALHKKYFSMYPRGEK